MDDRSTIEPILSNFRDINAIPRCSKKEERIRDYLKDRAGKSGFSVRQDDAGNLVVRVPASAGCEKAPALVIQGHMDMVCEKRSESNHDFEADPIQMYEEDEWLRAEDTTLGADNGIALAMALALAEDDAVVRPPLELLFTVDEETGLTGANRLDPGMLSGRVLLNVDSEDEGIFTVGCAGGVENRLKMPLALSSAEPGMVCFRLEAGGMRGGHSGVDIHKQRANALRVLARALDRVGRAGRVRILDLSGGRSHNAIPRSAAARFLCPEERRAQVEETLLSVERAVRMEHADTDPSLKLTVAVEANDEGGQRAVTAEDSLRIVHLLLSLPDGVQAMSMQIEGLVETSCNLASVSIVEHHLQIVTSQRSSVMSRLEDITRRIEAIGALAGAVSERMNAYPAWEPNLDSPLLARCTGTYRSLFGRDPEVEAIHAGLECAVIGARYEGMDMISFGPTIRDPHSPDEALYLPSVGKVWEFLKALAASYAKGG